MKQYLYCLLGLLPFTTLAQQPQRPMPPADTLYFDRDWARTDIPEDRPWLKVWSKSRIWGDSSLACSGFPLHSE